MVNQAKLVGGLAMTTALCSASFLVGGLRASKWCLGGICASGTLLVTGLLPQQVSSTFSWLFHRVIIRSPHARKAASEAEWNFNEIRPNLFLGRQPRNAEDLKELERLGVRAVVCLNEEWELFVPPSSPLPITPRLPKLWSASLSNSSTNTSRRLVCTCTAMQGRGALQWWLQPTSCRCCQTP